MDRPSSDQFKTLAVDVRQHRPEPPQGRSRDAHSRTAAGPASRNVSMKAWRQRRLPASVDATKDRGNPPRSHKSFDRRGVTSSNDSPPSSWNAIRPARVSDVWRSNSGEALPRTRKRAPRGRSASTRSVGNISGLRCTSSRTTSPRNGSSASSGSVKLGEVAARLEVEVFHLRAPRLG